MHQIFKVGILKNKNYGFNPISINANIIDKITHICQNFDIIWLFPYVLLRILNHIYNPNKCNI